MYYIMESFHIIVLSIATIVLILILIIVGMLLGMGDSTTIYPPTYGICPDYWEIEKDTTKCIIPKIRDTKLNIGSIYDLSTMSLNDNITNTPGYSFDISNNNLTQYIDFNDPKWNGVCDKKKWTNEYGIVWDGVSNYNSC